MTDPTGENPESSAPDEEPVDDVDRDVDIGPMAILVNAARDRRGGVFAALGCVLFVVLCCFGTTTGLVGWGALRFSALGEARDAVGVPSGWEIVDDSRWPWAAFATMDGPADVDAVTDWLADIGADPTEAEARACLTDDPCTVTGRSNGFDVTVVYGPADDGRSTASVTVD